MPLTIEVEQEEDGRWLAEGYYGREDGQDAWHAVTRRSRGAACVRPLDMPTRRCAA